MVETILKNQRKFFLSQKTKDLGYRKMGLRKLRDEIVKREDVICDAIYEDFKKPRFETLITETQFVLSELDYILKNIEEWCSPKQVPFVWANFPSKDYIVSEPYGNTLIIAPWNYPFMLAISPLIGALAAGNTAVVKPSELTPNTSKVIAELIKAAYNGEYVSVVEGGVKVSQELLNLKWDYIFFTGSTRVGKIIYKSAAENLTPVTLELGGKSPCIVDSTAKIKLAAKRIAWGKFINNGQTCIAPDYILVHTSVKQKLVHHLKLAIREFYGENPEQSPDLARIVTKDHYERLKHMLIDQTILFGGHYKDDGLFLSPTLLDEPKIDSKAMAEEIFGPVLPIISYENESDIDTYLTQFEKPLSLYVFSKNKKFQKTISRKYSFGGGCINDTLMHIANKNLPFGGIGSSGIGNYHGKYTFDTFSHKKAVLKKANWLDLTVRYAPYTIPLKWAKKIKYFI
ncbi:aldehyde dehydrogenase [Costertonia aggregata]|uniref:Aldehyde dehydrogenase n=1 Tax=Costertonia aggregata TaxID=343403 RepID=A0A7H9ART8_9FLAO|nr:aldehyde dehydrogenase [Costertonia aggregata]QLG46117.1 aldehyde dehydrogenase [Costertonia aggregata]